MARIIRFRDEEKCQSTMTAAIVNEIGINWDCENNRLMCPPDYVTRECSAMVMYDHHFDRLECLIANGGNPNDTTVISRLLDKQYYTWSTRTFGTTHFLGRRRIVELETYNRLKSLGCEMKEEDFIAVDQKDKRASVELFQARKVKSQLDSGVAFCDIEKVQDRIKRMLDRSPIWHNNRFIDSDDLTVRDMMEILTDWLKFDLSDYRANIHSFMSTLRKA